MKTYKTFNVVEELPDHIVERFREDDCLNNNSFMFVNMKSWSKFEESTSLDIYHWLKEHGVTDDEKVLLLIWW